MTENYPQVDARLDAAVMKYQSHFYHRQDDLMQLLSSNAHLRRAVRGWERSWPRGWAEAWIEKAAYPVKATLPALSGL